jgi:hypothetical protein
MVYSIIVRTAEVKRPPGRPWPRFEDNIRKDLRRNNM